MTNTVSKNPANKAKLRHFVVPRVVVPSSMLSYMLQIDCNDNPAINDFSLQKGRVADVEKFERVLESQQYIVFAGDFENRGI